jgi:phytol kinase
MTNPFWRHRERKYSIYFCRLVPTIVTLTLVWFVVAGQSRVSTVHSFSPNPSSHRSKLSKDIPNASPSLWINGRHGTSLTPLDTKKRFSGLRSDESSAEPSSSSGLVLWTALSLLTTAILAAYTGILPGYVDDTLLLWRDVGSTMLTAILGYAFVQLNTWAVRTDRLAPRDARKIIHTFSAPLFMLFWPLFSSAPAARVLAALVPTVNAVRLFLASRNDRGDESDLAAAVSRSGNRNEALGGPFIYVIMLALSMLLFWRDSPAGIVAMSCLAAGDGMADLCGRRFGASNPWPFAKKKSVAGSLAFVLASTFTATGLLVWMQYTGCLVLPNAFSVMDIAVMAAEISVLAAVFELIPWLGDDNYTVPISAAIASLVLFHSTTL